MIKQFESRQGRCLAGVAQCDITPPVGIYHRMWGAATHERSTGVHRPLMATVLVLNSEQPGDGRPRVLIGVDHCLFWPTEMGTFLDDISSHAGVDRQSLIVFFSHTHGAGLMGLERRELAGGDLIEPYLKETARKVADLINEAKQKQTAATIVFGTGRCSLATNRDFYDAGNRHYVCGFNPSGPADDTVLVGRVTRDGGVTMATIVNYACHPTTLAWENTLISPDYIGAMREVVESETGVPCLFMQGASGDIGPREGFVGDVQVADRNGRQLGYAALSTLESLTPAGQSFEYTGPVVSGATIGTWKYKPASPSTLEQKKKWATDSEIVALKYRSDLPVRADLLKEREQWRREEADAIGNKDQVKAKHAHAMVERADRGLNRIAALPEGATYPYSIIGWRIGDSIWIALDGEHNNILQRTLRDEFPDVALVIGTIANGSTTWYFPDQASFGLGLYQEEVSVLAKGSLEAVIDAATRLIRRLVDQV